MGYDPRFAVGDQLLPEELELQDALAAAGYTYDVERYRMFVPGKRLYQTYCNYVSGHEYRDYDGYAAIILNPGQFGVALRRAFPDIIRTRRRYQGRSEWGYPGFSGPGCIQTHSGPGRPVPVHGTSR